MPRQTLPLLRHAAAVGLVSLFGAGSLPAFTAQRGAGFPATWENLRAWLQDGGARGLDAVTLVESEASRAGRGLLAQRNFSQAELVVSIPRSLCLTAEANQQRPEERMAAALLREKCLGEESQFRAYIDYLLMYPSWTHPALLDGGWRRHFAASPGALRRIRLARMRAAAAVLRMSSWSDQEVRWALAAVGSRAFPDGSGLMMCPLLDLLNHAQSAGPPCGFLRLEGAVGMVAERDIQADEELCHLYALSPSSTLFASYGFVPSGGAGGFEETFVEVSAASLSEPHLKALARRGLRVSRRRLLLRLFGNLGSSLILPVARLLTLPAAELHREVEVFEKCQELPDPELELKACALAEGWLKDQHQKTRHGLASLEESDEVQRAAAELLRSEKKLMKTALDWLEERKERTAALVLK
eukprot:s168_g17.t1